MTTSLKDRSSMAGLGFVHGTRDASLFIAQVVVYLAAVWAIWEGIIYLFSLPSYLVPSPMTVVKSFGTLYGYYASNAWVTFYEAALGATIGFLSGFFLGVLLRYGGPIAASINPIILASQVFPKEALAPLILIFLGFGVFPKIVISALMCFFPVVISTTKGLYATPAGFQELMHVIGAKRWEVFRRCHLPFAAPYILASLRVCATLSVIGAVVGEFVGSSAGLGHVIRASSADLGTERVYAALILLGFQGAAFYGVALWIEKGLFGRFSKVY